MSCRFVLRVDDVGQALRQSEPDRNLGYFKLWWRTGRWEGLPIYLGVVPAVCGEAERDWLRKNVPPSQVALHGWDHSDEPLSVQHVAMASDCFPESRVVVPPYNKYDERTLVGVRRLLPPSPVLLGGFDGEHHPYGEYPTLVAGVLHLSADPRLYARCYQLVPTVKALLASPTEEGRVLQIVLHHRWDAETMEGVRPFRDLVGPHLVSVDEVKT